MLEDAWAGRILFFRRYEALSSEALFFRRYDASARKSQDKIDFFMPGALAVQFPFFFLAAGILNVTVAPWQYNSLFFLWQLPSHTVPLGIYGPVARWRLEKNAWPFFFWFLGQCPSQCVQTKKKTKIKKKAAKKKSCYINIKKKKSPFSFFL